MTKVFIARFRAGNIRVAINFFTPHSDIVQIDAIQVRERERCAEKRNS